MLYLFYNCPVEKLVTFYLSTRVSWRGRLTNDVVIFIIYRFPPNCLTLQYIHFQGLRADMCLIISTIFVMNTVTAVYNLSKYILSHYLCLWFWCNLFGLGCIIGLVVCWYLFTHIRFVPLTPSRSYDWIRVQDMLWKLTWVVQLSNFFHSPFGWDWAKW